MTAEFRAFAERQQRMAEDIRALAEGQRALAEGQRALAEGQRALIERQNTFEAEMLSELREDRVETDGLKCQGCG